MPPPAPVSPEVPPSRLSTQLSKLVRGFTLVVAGWMGLHAVVLSDSWRRAVVIVGSVALLSAATEVLNRRHHARLGAEVFVGGLLLLIFGLSWTAGGIHAPALGSVVPMVLIAGLLLGFRAGTITAVAAGAWTLFLVTAELLGWLPPPLIRHTTGSLALILLFNLALIGLTLWLTTEEVRHAQRLSAEAEDARTRTQTALAESEQRLALALEAATDGIYDIDFTTGAVYCNPRYFSMLGYGPGEITASLETWRGLLHPDDRPIAEAAMARYFSNGADSHSIETRLRAKDGSWRWVLSRGRINARSPEGAPLRLVGTHVDITERKQAELALRQAKDFAEKLIATANALIVCLDNEGEIVVFNATAEATTGYTAAELAGRDWFATVVPRERFPQVWTEFERLQSGGLPEHYENPILTKSGEERIIVWRNGVLRDGERAIGTISFGIDVTEARRTEQALAKERDLVARLVETSPAGILVVDTAGLIIFANHEAERILALQRAGPGRHNYAPPDWKLLDAAGNPVPEEQRAFRRVLASGQPIHDVCHLLEWSSGRRVHLSINATPLFDPAGKIEAVISTLEDVTDRQHAEDALRQSEERLRSIVDHAPFGSHLYELMPDGRLVLQGANQSADVILHTEHRPLLGLDIGDAFPGLRGTEIPETYRRVITTGQPLHQPTVNYDARGITGAFDVHALPIGHNRVVVFFADITERERAAAALRHSEERYRQLFNSGNDAVFVHGFGADGKPDRFTQVNDIACRLLGYSREELLARTPAEISDPRRTPEIAAVIALLRREHRALFDMELVARDGRRLAVEINSNVFDLEGRPAVLSIVRDLSERHRLEEQLRQAQKMETFGQLAGGVAHDFNNLLVAIIGNAELLLDSSELPGRHREQVAQIQDAGRRAAALTRQLLLFARKQPPQTVACDLGAIVSDHVKLLRRIIGEDIELVLELASAPLPILADVNMVEQVAMNLVVNARDAMPRGGTLTISTALAGLDEAAAARALCPPGSYAALRVRDTGCGIPAALRQRIFEPFFTTKPTGQGTGLGLATVLGIVQQHHGGITLESDEGHGSEFTVLLPLTSGPAKSPAKPVTAAARPATPATILVVEDDTAVRTIIDRTLGRAGYRVFLAASAAEGLEQLERCAAVVDLVLSDVVMPGGVDGGQLADRIASRWPAIPVLLMSGYTKDLERLPSRVLQKPFSTTQLLEFIREGLARRQAQAG